MTIQDITAYEIAARWWPQFIFWKWGRDLCSIYLAWVVQRKWARYQRSLKDQEWAREYARENGLNL